MRKFNKLALAGIVLAGAAGFTACSSDDDITAGTNPTYDGEAIKTQFAINVPAGGKSTRLTESVVQGQNTPTFRGMTNIRLVPFILASDPTSDTPLTGETAVTENAINLADIDKSSGLTGSASYKVYNDIRLKTNTNAFLFYGEATKESTDATNGVLIPSYTTEGWKATTLNDIDFSLKQIADPSAAANTNAQNAMLAILDGIIKAEGWSSETENYLATLYTNFKSMKAGSSNSIKLAVQELYNTINSENGLVTGSENADDVIAAINTVIETYFDKGATSAPTPHWHSKVAMRLTKATPIRATSVCLTELYR